MARSKSSHSWLKDHFRDPFVKQAKKAGYRSRAAYKLLELQQKDHLFKPGDIIVDLGAAPGGWSQVVAELVGGKGRVFALDLLAMEKISGVEFIQGDFREDEILQQLLEKTAANKVNVIISDMAPNLSGIAGVDQARSMHLAELVLDLSEKILEKGGILLIKVFQGEGFDQFLKVLRLKFAKVMVRKPSASRAKSAEIYLVGKGFEP